MSETGFTPIGTAVEAKCRADALEAAAPEMFAALEEIAKGEGAFDRDPLKHASNAIESMKAIAAAALSKARGEAA